MGGGGQNIIKVNNRPNKVNFACGFSAQLPYFVALTISFENLCFNASPLGEVDNGRCLAWSPPLYYIPEPEMNIFHILVTDIVTSDCLGAAT